MNSSNGWIKLYRSVMDNPVIMKDPAHLSVWIYLLLNATHKEIDVIFNGIRITLTPGQLITGRKVISTNLSISESKVQRILKCFQREQQIEQQTCSVNRLTSITNWQRYQVCEQQNDQQVNNPQTTSEHKQECKNVRMKEEDLILHSLNAFINNLKQVKKLTHPTHEEWEKLISEYGLPAVKNILLAMENYKNVKNYTSIYLTANKWLKSQKESDTPSKPTVSPMMQKILVAE